MATNGKRKILVRGGLSPRHRVRLKFEDKSRALQSAKDECDINNIMANWRRTGIITHGQIAEGKYEDLADVPTDYHESMNRIIEAQEAFASLPSSVRKQFNNDPAQLLDNISDPANRQILIDAGLLKADLEGGKKDAQPDPERTASPPAPEATPDPEPNPLG